MAYYYVTNTYDVYKTVGTRRVKLIYSINAIKKIIALSNEITKKTQGLPSIIIPMIRRTFPQLIASDLVSIQPMSAPVGASFYLRHTFDIFKRRSKRKKIDLYKARNTIPLYVFKKKYTFILKTSNFHEVIFELSCKNL